MFCGEVRGWVLSIAQGYLTPSTVRASVLAPIADQICAQVIRVMVICTSDCRHVHCCVVAGFAPLWSGVLLDVPGSIHNEISTNYQLPVSIRSRTRRPINVSHPKCADKEDALSTVHGAQQLKFGQHDSRKRSICLRVGLLCFETRPIPRWNIAWASFGN